MESRNNRPEAAPDRDSLYELAEFFRVFGDTSRIRILYALLDGEKCGFGYCKAAGHVPIPPCPISCRRCGQTGW